VPWRGAIALLRVTPLTSGPFLCSLDFHVLQGSQQFDIHLTDEAETFSFCDNLFVSRTFFVAPASSQAAYNDDNDFTLIYDQGSGNPRFATLAVSGGPAGAAIVLGVNRDFNGDGKADILWRHSSGAVYIWLMDGASVIGQGSPGSVGTDWTVEAVADFNGDGKADILWRHSSGVVYIWLMNGTAVSTAGSPGSVGLDWTIQTVADFNGDGKADILWRHSSGAVYIWHMNGTSVSSVGSAGSVGLDWTVQ